MKQLLLMRHAKSDRSARYAEDHDRPLNPRGRAAAPRMAEWLASRGAAPDAVLVSSAARTTETFDHLRRVMPGLPRPQVLRELYLAEPEDILALLAELPDGTGSAMVIGHQPGLGDLVAMLANGEAPAQCRSALEHFPTAAVAVLEADISAWSDLPEGAARFVDYATPKGLAGA